MTQLSSFGPSAQFGEATSSHVADAAGRVLSTIQRPDVLVVLAVCAAGLILTLVAASTLAGFSDSFSEAAMLVGP